MVQKLYTDPAVTAIDASDLNSASIAIGDLAGSQTVARSATSVGSTSETYTFSTTGLPGLSVTPSVTSFIAAPRSVTPWTVSFLCTPQAVTIGQTIPTTFGWSGLPAGNRYLGRVQYVDAAAPSTAMASTVIGVSTR